MRNILFKFQKNAVRIVFKNNEPWFIAKDVCDVLEIVRHRDALRDLEPDERERLLVDTLGGRQEMAAVNESGLYHLIFRSRKPVAKEFRKWVTSEVLPSIRKYGFYLSSTPKDQEKIDFIQHFFPKAEYGVQSDLTGLYKLIPVGAHFRSCRIARVNNTYQPTQQVFKFIDKEQS